MALWVQKFGGSSMADIDCIFKVASIIQQSKAMGHTLVVVVSAMAGDTDDLARLATQISGRPPRREWDALLACAENKSAALLSMVLHTLDVAACSLSAHQVKMLTTNHHQKAELLSIDKAKILKLCEQGVVPIITGFQGINHQGDMTTLGRGGSDITAVALAGFLSADECQIYTDVKGIYTADPRIIPQARLLDKITFSEMLALSGLGAQVLHKRAAELACRYHLPVRVLSTFDKSEGTLLYEPVNQPCSTRVAGIAFDRSITQITVTNLLQEKKFIEDLTTQLNHALIEMDMIICSRTTGERRDVHFTVKESDFYNASLIVNDVLRASTAHQVVCNQQVAKLSLVGLAMTKHVAVSTKMLQALADEGIAVQLITSSELKVSVVIDENYLELAARLLHRAFELQTVEKSSVEIF